MSTPRSVWPLLFSSLLGLAILCSLGVWQVNRLAQKNAQIAAIDARMAAESVALSGALNRHEAGENVEYTKVTAKGSFLQSAELRKLTSVQGGAGFQLIAPLLTDDGILILVDRGAIPANTDNYAKAGLAPQDYQGILRYHNQGQGLFDAENDPKANQWFWWDVPAMLGQTQAPPEAKVSDLVLQLLPAQGQKLPAAAIPKAELRNNHLGYALTWFGLAVVLAVMTLIFVIRQRRETLA